MIKIGNNNVLLKVGSQNVQAAYLGSTLVYSPTTTTTTTSTTSTTSTTTANPIPSGAFAIFDFGNPSSYSGTGTTVNDISGNGGFATLFNSPTWTSTNGGRIRFNNASSQYMEYGGIFTPDTSVVTIWQNIDANFSKDTGFPTRRVANGLMMAFLGGSKGFCPILFDASNNGNTYFGATTTPSDITQWHQYAEVVTYSSPNTTATTYLDGNASSATETKSFNRSGTSANGTIYVGRDNAVGDRYANGYLMAYLHYNRALTTAELNSIYAYYSSRWGATTTTSTTSTTTTSTTTTTTTTTTTAAPTTTTTTAAATTTTTTLFPLQYWNVRKCNTSDPTTALAIDTGVTLVVGYAIRPTIAPNDTTPLPGYENACYELISTTTSGTYCGIRAPSLNCATNPCQNLPSTTTTTTAAP